MIEQIDDGDVCRFLDEPDARYIEELFSSARRIAMGVEKALDSILDELGEEPEPEPAPRGGFGDDVPF